MALAFVGGAARAEEFAPAPPGLPGGDINTFQLYVSDQVTYDDNLFRIPPGTAGVPGTVLSNASQSDAINVPTLGGQGKWAIGQQEFELNVRADQYRFLHNDSLDFTASNAAGYWNWHLGPYLSGQVVALFDRSLAGFGQTRFSGKDVTTSLEELGFARYQLGPHWALYGQIRGSYYDHGAQSEQIYNFHNKAGYSGVEYATSVNDTFAFEYQYLDITLSRFPITTGFGSLNYTENSGRFKTRYALTDKTSLEGYAGYQRRTYPDGTSASYSGLIWRGGLAWQVTDKTNVTVGGWHELHAYQSFQSDYFIARGFHVAPAWAATEKLSLVFDASYEDQNYLRSSTSVVTAGGLARHDKLEAGQATIRWTPRDALTVDIFYRHEKRNSNQYIFSFNDNIVSGNVVFRFW